MTVPDLTGVVLAGGESTRFEGGDKALATVDGRPLLDHVVATLGAVTGRPPVVVTRGRADRYDDALSTDAQFARDLDDFDGPLAGLLGGLAAVETGWGFVSGCDMPGLSRAAVEWLAGYRAETLDAVVVRSRSDVREPLHALYDARAAVGVRQRLTAEAGPQALLDRLSVRDVPRAAAPDGVDLSTSLVNVNTRADLHELVEDDST